MKVILEPTATIVGKTQFIDHPDFVIPPDGDDSIRLSSFGAKGCYDSFGIDGRPNLDNQFRILESAHGSVLEHFNVSIYVTGVTRGLTLEMNRHRQFGISQRSTRYTKEEDASIVLEPYYAQLFTKCDMRSMCTSVNNFIPSYTWESYSNDCDANEKYLIFKFLSRADDAFEEYQSEVELLMKLNPEKLEGFALRKWARGKARNILPHALETRVLYTANLRAWRWFIEARSSRHAESEIRRLADVILTQLKTVSPFYFEDFEQTGVFEGIPEWTPKFRKV